MQSSAGAPPSAHTALTTRRRTARLRPATRALLGGAACARTDRAAHAVRHAAPRRTSRATWHAASVQRAMRAERALVCSVHCTTACTALRCALHRTAACTALHRTALHCSVHYSVHRTALHCTAPHSTAPHRTTPHCTAACTTACTAALCCSLYSDRLKSERLTAIATILLAPPFVLIDHGHFQCAAPVDGVRLGMAPPCPVAHGPPAGTTA